MGREECGKRIETGFLVWIEALPAGRMNSEVYRSILSAQIRSNASKPISRHFAGQMGNDPKCTTLKDK